MKKYREELKNRMVDSLFDASDIFEEVVDIANEYKSKMAGVEVKIMKFSDIMGDFIKDIESKLEELETELDELDSITCEYEGIEEAGITLFTGRDPLRASRATKRW